VVNMSWRDILGVESKSEPFKPYPQKPQKDAFGTIKGC